MGRKSQFPARVNESRKMPVKAIGPGRLCIQGAMFAVTLAAASWTSTSAMADDARMIVAISNSNSVAKSQSADAQGQMKMLAFPFKVRDDGPYRQQELVCARPTPAPVIDLDVGSIYTPGDETHSRVDPKAQEVYLAKMKAVRSYASDVVRMANSFHANGDLEAAACALTWLQDWAKSDALSKLQTRQAYLTSTRVLSGLALGMMQVMPVADQMKDIDVRLIQDWFVRRAEPLIEEVYGDPEDRASNRQNHRYWGGLAVASIGVVTGRKDFLEWGVESYRLGVCEIADNGTLPLELARGKRARQYHNHALAPLILIAEIAESNGIDAYSFCDSAIHRLVRFLMTSVFDESEIEKMTGHKQIPIPKRPGGYYRGDRFAWAEPYRARFPDKAEVFRIDDLKLRRPLYSTNLGGETTTLFVR
jgi:poly(beta-D-mannuronate) lyase